MTHTASLFLLALTACERAPAEAPALTEAPAPTPAEATAPAGPDRHLAPRAQAEALQAEDFNPDDWGAGADIVTLHGDRVFIDLRDVHDDLDCQGTPKDGRLTLSCDTTRLDAAWTESPDGSVTTDLFALAHGREAQPEALVALPGPLNLLIARAQERRSAALAQRYAGAYSAPGGPRLELTESGALTRDGQALSATLAPCAAEGLGEGAAAGTTDCLLISSGAPKETHYAWAEGWVPVEATSDFPQWEVRVVEGGATLTKE